mmetsp:Transcript_16251/g.33458  ORF Transcript_16251/g.33458 Transcript_16251/m.33458 type:complete len:372 (-) Transcript_16251:78-1193(-)
MWSNVSQSSRPFTDIGSSYLSDGWSNISSTATSPATTTTSNPFSYSTSWFTTPSQVSSPLNSDIGSSIQPSAYEQQFINISGNGSGWNAIPTTTSDMLGMDKHTLTMSSPSSTHNTITTNIAPNGTGKKKKIEQEISGQNLYKTELCRSFQETGDCRYGTKCQFAHGKAEQRPVLRHPKYKTQVCKTFTSKGRCPYGHRCRFIHSTSPERDSNDYVEHNTKSISSKINADDQIPYTASSQHHMEILSRKNSSTTTSSPINILSSSNQMNNNYYDYNNNGISSLNSSWYIEENNNHQNSPKSSSSSSGSTNTNSWIEAMNRLSISSNSDVQIVVPEFSRNTIQSDASLSSDNNIAISPSQGQRLSFFQSISE